MNRAPDYLPVLHEIESKYGSISRAPDAEVARVQKAAGIAAAPARRPSYERGRQWEAFLAELDTENLTSYEILKAARKDERLSDNYHITIGTIYHMLKKYGVKYKKMSEV